MYKIYHLNVWLALEEGKWARTVFKRFCTNNGEKKSFGHEGKKQDSIFQYFYNYAYQTRMKIQTSWSPQ